MSTERKRILICIDWYEPGFKAGGPIRSVANMVSALKSDHEFYILTSAFDLGETEPYPGIELNEWHDRDGVFIKYMDRRALTIPSIKANIREIEPDLLYLNSLFSKLFTLAPLLAANRMKTKVVLAPRGMLGQGPLGIKAGKKKIFLVLAKLVRLFRKVTWHVSTKEEEKDVRNVFGNRANIIVAQNIPVTQVKTLNEILSKKNTGHTRFVYIGRITPIKNTAMIVRAVKKLKGDKPIFLDIYGTIEDPVYFDSFRAEITSDAHITMEYKGALNPAAVSDVYSNADYMILPTQHENYGHAIVEAWASGCPVIISRYTPWKRLQPQELGWDVDIENEQNLVNALQEAVDMDFTSYLSMVRASHTYFAEKISDPAVIAANRKLFE